MNTTSVARSRYDAADAVIVLVIFAATVAYLAALPRYLGAADEAVHLYDAKRVMRGAVIYRDFFTVITPGFMYLMAALFRLFGASIATARIGAAVIDGLTVVTMYLSCRRLGVRRLLAWLPAVAYLIVCQPAWPIASQHWLSTLLCTVTLLACIVGPDATASARAFPGIAIGLLLLVQQQRGVFVAVGVFVWVVIDYAVERWYRVRAQMPRLVARLAYLVGGAVAVVLPVMLVVLAVAGVEPVWRALVLFPIFNYGAVTHCPWGHVNLLSAVQAKFTYPRLLAYLPIILPLTAIRAIILAGRRRVEERARHLVLLLVFCLTSMLSISYFPDFIHIAFIAPAFFVTIAESAEWLLCVAVGPAAGRSAAPMRRIAALLGAGAAVAASVVVLYGNLQFLRATYPFSRSTAFGQIDFPNTDEAELYDRVKTLMDDSSARYLYAYPVAAHLYLMIDVDNPTTYGWFLAPFYDADQVGEVMAELNAAPLPYILLFSEFTRPDDTVVQWIHQHYEQVPGTGRFAKVIYRRTAVADAAPGHAPQ